MRLPIFDCRFSIEARAAGRCQSIGRVRRHPLTVARGRPCAAGVRNDDGPQRRGDQQTGRGASPSRVCARTTSAAPRLFPEFLSSRLDGPYGRDGRGGSPILSFQSQLANRKSAISLGGPTMLRAAKPARRARPGAGNTRELDNTALSPTIRQCPAAFDAQQEHFRRDDARMWGENARKHQEGA